MGKLFRNKFFVALLMILSIGSAVNANAQKSKFPSMKQLAASATQHIKTGHMINRAPKAKAPDANAEVLYDSERTSLQDTTAATRTSTRNTCMGKADGGVSVSIPPVAWWHWHTPTMVE